MLRFDTNSDITTVIKIGASNRIVFMILILFDVSSISGVSVNFNISAIIWIREPANQDGGHVFVFLSSFCKQVVYFT